MMRERRSAEECRAKIEQLKGRRQFHEEKTGRLRESVTQETSLTVPDSRLMMVGRGLDVCYNVQTAGRDGPAGCKRRNWAGEVRTEPPPDPSKVAAQIAPNRSPSWAAYITGAVRTTSPSLLTG